MTGPGWQCAVVVAAAAAWLDEPARQPAGDREETEMHLLVCPACVTHLGRLTELRAALRALPGAQPPAQLLSVEDGRR